jgi:acyl-CoA carboxylase subunit beta
MSSHPAALSSAARIALVADPDSFEPFDDDIVATDPLGFRDSVPYPERIRAARERTGSSESVRTGTCRVGGRPLVVIASEFDFIGGSIGVAAGERIARALERAAERRLAVLALVASGGSRMQEGTLALVQMAKLADAVTRFRRAGGLYITYWMHPMTGGALASWASLGSVMLAQPDALVGFAGPRVAAALSEHPPSQEAQRAETLFGAGWLDALVEPAALRGVVRDLLDVTRPPTPGTVDVGPRAVVAPPTDAWEDLRRVRAPERFGVRDVLAAWRAPVSELHGDRSGRPDDPACLTALTRIAGRPLVLVAHDRSRRGGALGPAGLAKARRAMRLAGELGLPLVTIIDTPGAELSDDAERGALAGEIALALQALAEVDVPTVSVLLGQGGSGGAVAFLPADRTLALAGAGLWVIAPEGASVILFREPRHAPQLARSQAGSAGELLRHGIVDELVADDDASTAAAALEAAVDRVLGELTALDPAERLAQRQRRLRTLASRG